MPDPNLQALLAQYPALAQYLGQGNGGGSASTLPASMNFGDNWPELPQPPEDSIVHTDPTKTRPADQRMEGYRRLLTNFTYSLGTGLSAAGAGGHGRNLRTMAGMGQILQAPVQLQAAQQKYEMEQAQAAERLAAARKSDLSALLLPAQLQKILADAGLSTTRAGAIPAQTAATTATAGAAVTNAQTNANRGKYLVTPQGTFDISGETPTLVKGSEPIEFEVTQAIADKFHVPELLGQKVPTSTFNQIIKENTPMLRLTPMKDPDGGTGLYSVDLQTGEKLRVGEPKSDVVSPQREAQLTRIAKAAYDIRQPAGSADDVKYIADQVDADPTGQLINKLVGNNQILRQQVVHELNTRDADLRVLTAATRQLGETAHELMPNFDHALEALNDKGVQSAMGVLGSRWQDFIAGKIGSSDPALRGANLSRETIAKVNDLRTFVSLLQTGTARAHVGARGSNQLQAKFEKLFSAETMDIQSLRDTMSSTRNFLKTYENAVFGEDKKPDATPPPAAAATPGAAPAAKPAATPAAKGPGKKPADMPQATWDAMAPEKKALFQ